mgnify:CR=1 FL=1
MTSLQLPLSVPPHCLRLFLAPLTPAATVTRRAQPLHVRRGLGTVATQPDCATQVAATVRVLDDGDAHHGTDHAHGTDAECRAHDGCGTRKTRPPPPPPPLMRGCEGLRGWVWWGSERRPLQPVLWPQPTVQAPLRLVPHHTVLELRVTQGALLLGMRGLHDTHGSVGAQRGGTSECLERGRASRREGGGQVSKLSTRCKVPRRGARVQMRWHRGGR